MVRALTVGGQVDADVDCEEIVHLSFGIVLGSEGGRSDGYFSGCRHDGVGLLMVCHCSWFSSFNWLMINLWLPRKSRCQVQQIVEDTR